MVRKPSATKNVACDAIVDLIDDGTNSPWGTLRIQTSDSTSISIHRLSNPSFFDAVDGTATADFIYDATALIDGTAALFDFYSRSDAWVWGGTVTGPGGGGELELSSISIPADTTVSITSAKYIVP